MERKIERLDRKVSILDWVLSRCLLNRTTNGITLAGAIGAGCMIIGAILVLLEVSPAFAGLLMVGPLLGFPVVACIGQWFIYPFLKDKLEMRSCELEDRKKEILKQIDCARREVDYVKTSKQVGETAQLIELGKMVSSVYSKVQERKRKEREEVLRKAKEVGIDVDRIMSGQDAYSSKKEYKEAKEDLDNFFEENNIVL